MIGDVKRQAIDCCGGRKSNKGGNTRHRDDANACVTMR